MSRRSFLLAWSGAFLVFLLLSPLLWTVLDGWASSVRAGIWSAVESAAGRPVSYDRLSPSVLAALEFRNVRIDSDDGRPLVRAASLRIVVDWTKVLQGKFSEAVSRVQLINASVELDADRDRAVLDRWAGLLKGSGGGTPSPLRGLQIEGFNLSGRWTQGTSVVRIDRAFVTAAAGEGEWALKYRGALAWDAGTGAARGNVSVRGELRSDSLFRTVTGRVETGTVRTGAFELSPVSVQVRLDPEGLEADKVADRIPLDLQVSWKAAGGLWTVRGSAVRFRPSLYLRPSGGPSWASWLNGEFTGAFSATTAGQIEFNGRAEWPSGVLPAPLDQGTAVVEGQVSADSRTVRFRGLKVESPPLSASFTGSLDREDGFPEGEFRLHRWTVAGAGSARGIFRFHREANRIVILGESAGWNQIGSGAPSGWVEHRGPVWSFGAEGPWDGSAGGRFNLEGTWNSQTATLETSARVQGFPVSAALAEAESRLKGWDLPEDLRRLRADASATVLWSGRTGLEVRSASFSLGDPDRDDRRLAGNLTWNEGLLKVGLSEFRWDQWASSGTAEARFLAGGSVNWKLAATLADRPVTAVGRWDSEEKLLTFTGTPGLAGSLKVSAPGAWTARLAVAPLEVIPGWRAGFHGQASFDRGGWTADADDFLLEGLVPGTGKAFRLTGQLAADPGFLRLGELTWSDPEGVLSGTLISTWNSDFGQPWSGRLVAASSEAGRDSLRLDWTVSGPRDGRLTVQASGLDLARLGLPGLAGRAAGSGQVTFRDGQPVWSGQAALSEARWGEAPLGLRFSASGDAGQVSVRDLNLAVNPVRLTGASFDWSAADRQWTADLGVALRFGTGEWEGKWQARGRLSPDGAPLTADFQVRSRQNTWSRRAFPDWVVAGVWSPSGWEASLGDSALSARGSGEAFQVRAQSPFPVQGNLSGTFRDGQIALAVRDFRADLGLLKETVNSPLFALQSGRVSGEFDLTGPPGDPDLSGRLTIQGLSVTSSFVRQTVGPVDIPVVLEGHRITVEPVNVAPAGRTWMVSGAARLDHLVPEDYQFSVQTDTLSVLPVSYQYTGISAVGGVTGLLVVRGTPLALTLGGRLVLQDTTVTLKDQSAPAASGSGPGLGFNVDLTLVTGRKVEFLWPNETLPLLRAVTAPNQTLAVKANDVASTWSVAGKLALKAGEINYLQRTFVLREGQLVFNETQTGFDPRIAVRAEWRLRESVGTTTVNLRADGTLSRFQPRFDAVPYRSPEELQRLVGTTLGVPVEYTKGSADTAVSVASDVGTSFLLTPFEDAVKRNFGLDLFTVKTEILKKSLLNRNGPLEASDYLDNTRLFFGKYVGDDLFLQGTLAFRQDAAAAQGSSAMVVEPEFQMEFQTPFFLLNWTLLPQHPETLFVTDNTVTFRWDWSY